MKRMSIRLLLLVLAPGLAEASSYHYFPPRYRVHYSPYALRYGSTGLVPGGLDYSVHAISYHSCGLVPEGVRYTPYALRHDRSGLIYQYASLHGYPYRARPVYCAPVVQAKTLTHRRPLAASCVAADVPNSRSARRGGPQRVRAIRRHLRAKGFDRVGVNRVLSIDGAIVSADFRVPERNLLIKYWNPEPVDSLDSKSRLRQKAYEKYTRDWERYAERYKQEGGNIFTVTASDTQTIVAALDSCPALESGSTPDRGPRNPAPPTMYARD